MKKYTFLLLILIGAIANIKAQDNILNVNEDTCSLFNTYKQGSISIHKDNAFGKQNNYLDLFHSFYYNNSESKSLVTGLKYMAISKDGEIFIANYADFTIHKFDQNGNFLFSFGKFGYEEGDISGYIEDIAVLDDKYVLVKQGINGRVNIYNLNGKFIRTFVLDYQIFKFLALGDSRIIIYGDDIKDTDNSGFISIINVDTEEEHRVKVFKSKEHQQSGFSKLINRTLKLKNDIFLKPLSNQTFIVGESYSDLLQVYDKNGRNIKTINTELERKVIEPKTKISDSDYLYKKLMQRFFPNKETAKELKNNSIIKLPYYLDMMVDAQDNILLSTFTKDYKRLEFFVINPSNNERTKTSVHHNESMLGTLKLEKRNAFFRNYLITLIHNESNHKIIFERFVIK
ncbi:MAG: hypothetical protein ACEPOV_04605 [Hyphomicrobiales bacterium]